MAGRKVFNEQDARRCLTAVKASRSSLGAWAQERGAQELSTDLPVETIDNALRPFGDQRVVGTSRSDPNYAPDRSAYLCNYLGYNLAAEFGAAPKTTAGFMHISRETPPEQMHAVLEAVTARQLDWRREQLQPPPS